MYKGVWRKKEVAIKVMIVQDAKSIEDFKKEIMVYSSVW